MLTPTVGFPLFAGLMIFLSSTDFSTQRTWIDPVTGSEKTQTFWPFGFSSEPRVRTTALEEWLRRREPNYESQWRPASSTDHNLWGAPVLIACNSGAPIHQVREALDACVSDANDEELAEIVADLRSDEEALHDRAVHAILQHFDHWHERATEK